MFCVNREPHIRVTWAMLWALVTDLALMLMSFTGYKEPITSGKCG